MSTEQNEALVRRWFEEGWNRGHLEIADELFAPDYRTHTADPHLAGIVGPESPKRYTERYRTAFPDAHLTLDDVIAAGDEVVVRWTGRGTHQGEFLGVPPTGRRAAWQLVAIQRIGPDGKCAEQWASWDQLGLLQQLGALAPVGPASR